MREKGGEERSEGGRSQVVHNRAAETSQGSTVAFSTIQGGWGEAADDLCTWAGQQAVCWWTFFSLLSPITLQAGPIGC